MKAYGGTIGTFGATTPEGTREFPQFRSFA
jgi:hypothetical protein